MEVVDPSNKLKNAQAEEPTMLGSIREGTTQTKTAPRTGEKKGENREYQTNYNQTERCTRGIQQQNG